MFVCCCTAIAFVTVGIRLLRWSACSSDLVNSKLGVAPIAVSVAGAFFYIGVVLPNALPDNDVVAMVVGCHVEFAAADGVKIACTIW